MYRRSILAVLLFSAIAITAQFAAAQLVRGRAQERVPAHLQGRVHPTGKHTHAPDAGITPGTTVNGMTYHGGGVMLGTTNVYVVWYGNWSADAAAQSIILHALSYIGGTRYYNINAGYYDGSGRHVSNAVRYNGSATDNYSQGSTLNDAGVQAVVNRAIGLGHLPNDKRGVYFVLTSKDVHESSGFCSTYCGWHTHALISNNDIKYAFVGNAATQCAGACMGQTDRSPNGDPGADGMVNVIAHELSEAVTDPDLNAWYDSNGWENADKCVWNFGGTQTASNGSLYNVTLGGKQYLLQQNWVNASGGYCGLAY